MLITYTNNTDIDQVFFNENLDPVVVEPGETVSYVNKEGNTTNVDLLITKTATVGGTMTYIGYALPGTGEGEAGWAIKKRSVVGVVTSWLFAGGKFQLRYKFTERASLSYS